MLDIDKIREKKDQFRENLEKRQSFDQIAKVDEILKRDSKRRKLIYKIEELRSQRNKLSSQIGGNLDQDLIRKATQLKKEIQALEPELKEVEQELKGILWQMPNWIHPDVPVGKDESENKVLRRWGEPPRFDFEVKDHLWLGQELDLLDFETGAKVAGSKFYFLKNEAVLLEWALVKFGLDFLAQEGFKFFITPEVARHKILDGIGYQPRGNETQVYTLEGSEKGLIATAEITLGGYHSDEVLSWENLPLKYAGFSHCFRTEAGGYGRYSKGLYRVHQFSKLEMFIYCLPEESDEMHEYLLDLEEKIYQQLEIPYRVVEMCTGDLGAPAYRKYDVEAWMPGYEGGAYGEITSTSNTTDYQSRRLNIRYRNEKGEVAYLHTLNGTAIATSRTLIAILENYQRKDGSVVVPEVLREYVGKEVIKCKA